MECQEEKLSTTKDYEPDDKCLTVTTVSSDVTISGYNEQHQLISSEQEQTIVDHTVEEEDADNEEKEKEIKTHESLTELSYDSVELSASEENETWQDESETETTHWFDSPSEETSFARKTINLYESSFPDNYSDLDDQSSIITDDDDDDEEEDGDEIDFDKIEADILKKFEREDDESKMVNKDPSEDEDEDNDKTEFEFENSELSVNKVTSPEDIAVDDYGAGGIVVTDLNEDEVETEYEDEADDEDEDEDAEGAYKVNDGYKLSDNTGKDGKMTLTLTEPLVYDANGLSILSKHSARTYQMPKKHRGSVSDKFSQRIIRKSKLTFKVITKKLSKLFK